MKYIAIVCIVTVLCMVGRAYAHEKSVRSGGTALEIALHAIVFGGLGIAGINGARQNKKAHGKWIVW